MLSTAFSGIDTAAVKLVAAETCSETMELPSLVCLDAKATDVTSCSSAVRMEVASIKEDVKPISVVCATSVLIDV